VSQPALSEVSGRDRARWLERERGLLLPVDYHHVVFTLPHAFESAGVGQSGGLLWAAVHSAWATLREGPAIRVIWVPSWAW